MQIAPAGGAPEHKGALQVKILTTDLFGFKFLGFGTTQNRIDANCRTREKQLFLLALGTISFLCFGSIFFLPEKAGQVKFFIIGLYN